MQLTLLVIGASLNRPHTSVTALRTCMCVLACLLVCLWPYTVNLKWAHSRRSILCSKHVIKRATAMPKCSVQRKVKARVATSALCFYRTSTVGHSQAVQIWTVVEVTSGRASHAWHERHSNSRNCQAHELIVNLSLHVHWLSRVRNSLLGCFEIEL